MSRRLHSAVGIVLRNAALVLVSLLLLTGVRATAANAAGTRSNCSGEGAADAERVMRCLINEVRAQDGLRRLKASAALTRAAALKTQAIKRCRAFSHTPCGRRFTTVFVEAGYPVDQRVIAENLAWGTGAAGAPGYTLRAWLRSPPHRRNLLDPRFRELGVHALALSRFLGYRHVTLWVASFGG
jgi:uncharacterized protein YkwD